ncbi:Lrp/AsnC family transcriptional regulator [Thermococcus sp. M39]|uniref:Lrp/AsnC family transcriptional regulator n=1 Tax=unclassified Thermococcus TaxID=2627626 RepID=UPI00143B6D32|nr:MULTISPECIES: Lrp/AsnC family transcriptional regulator [unclassified Thermococcus]NJE08073.1 Lrp/AsnC family transcriptional regulator [Thermococcus sp. M39]NJE11566.1 Lrp/AsnC family transcriptional regulator [Thermococcus sp. LS2]
MMGENVKLTSKQIELLRKLYNEGKPIEVHTVEKSQEELARELKVTRQALSFHLKTLKEIGYIRTGRGFIDLTRKAVEFLENGKNNKAFIFVKIDPTKRKEVYEEIKELNGIRAYRVTGNIDIVIEVDRTRFEEILDKVSSIDGVRETITHFIIEPIA